MTSRPPPFDAVILAGGRAARLGGADKPGLFVGGRTLVAAVVAAAAEAVTVTIVGPQRAELHALRPDGTLRFVREDPPGGGPVVALRRGIMEVARPWVAVLAGDLPFLRPNHLRRLLAAAGACPTPAETGSAADAATSNSGRGPGIHKPMAGRAGAVALDEESEPQWLASCWQAVTLREALRAYDGRSLRGLLTPLRPAGVVFELAAGEPPPWLDCDSPEELRQAREWKL